MQDNSPMPLEIISGIWKQVLGVEQVLPADDFFGLGGDSVMVTIMALQVEEALSVMVSADLIFDHPTLGAFASAVAEEQH